MSHTSNGIAECSNGIAECISKNASYKYVALPVDVDGRVWTGSEARVVHGGKRMFMDGLLWTGKEWRIYQRSADGSSHSIDLWPEKCVHAVTFREVIQKALSSDPTQELEDELVEMCERVVDSEYCEVADGQD